MSATMTQDDTTTRTITAPIQWVGTFAGSKCCRVMIDGESVQLKVPKGSRGVKVGALLSVRIERRSWYSITRTRIDLRNGGSETTSERGEYHDGPRDHYYFDGVAAC